MHPIQRALINGLLLFLTVWDLLLSAVCLLIPETWFLLFHGAPYVDPQGLLRRTGAVWAAFTLFQLIAYFRWPREPYWLPLVAGIRLTEVFSDWIYLYVAEGSTWFGRLGLFIAPPSNVVLGWFFIWSYRKIQRETSRQG
jgi:hypothetical protein